MKPIVCIVGRPNVGKSTLFNKLVGRRIAITEDRPGMTRDRLYQDAQWQNHAYTLVDTGGLDPNSDEVFETHILNQAQVAIESATVILFVVDGKSGLTHGDREIARLLRTSNKPVILVVNKIDHRGMENNIYEFYELGFDALFSISSEQSLGIGDLLDAMVEFFPRIDMEEEDVEIPRIALIGKPNVGKSSLINHLLGEERMIVTDIAGTTRDAIDSHYRHGEDEYILIDTAGLRRKRAVVENAERYSVVRTLSAVDRSEIVLLLIDAAEGVSEQDTKIAGYAHDNGKAMIILVNKWDLIEKNNRTFYQFEKEIREKLGFVPYAPILFISVKTGQRVGKIFDLVKMVYNNYHLRISTGLLNEIINDCVLHNPPPSDKGVRLKIFYATQASVAPPTFILFVNRVELMHFSYLRYIENRIRDHFGYEGVPLVFQCRARGESQG